MLLVYDGDCGFCRRCADWAKAHGRSIAIVAWQDADLDALGLAPEQCQAAVQLVDGPRQASGGAAVAQVLRQCDGAWPAIGATMAAPGFRRLTELGYRIVAARRGRWPFKGA